MPDTDLIAKLDALREAYADAVWKLHVDAVGFLRGMGRYPEADANATRLRTIDGYVDALAAKHREDTATIAALRDRLAAYIGAREFDDGCLCEQCVRAITNRLNAADEILAAANLKGADNG